MQNETAVVENNYGAEEWRQPEHERRDTVLFSECGRILDKVDYRSHWFKLVKPEFGAYALLVKHGGGEERIPLGYARDHLKTIFAMLDSDARFLLMHEMLDIHHTAAREARARTDAEIKQAFVEGRLKKRKMLGRDEVKVWIERPGGGEQ